MEYRNSARMVAKAAMDKGRRIQPRELYIISAICFAIAIAAFATALVIGLTT